MSEKMPGRASKNRKNFPKDDHPPLSSGAFARAGFAALGMLTAQPSSVASALEAPRAERAEAAAQSQEWQAAEEKAKEVEKQLSVLRAIVGDIRRAQHYFTEDDMIPLFSDKERAFKRWREEARIKTLIDNLAASKDTGLMKAPSLSWLTPSRLSTRQGVFECASALFWILGDANHLSRLSTKHAIQMDATSLAQLGATTEKLTELLLSALSLADASAQQRYYPAPTGSQRDTTQATQTTQRDEPPTPEPGVHSTHEDPLHMRLTEALTYLNTLTSQSDHPLLKAQKPSEAMLFIANLVSDQQMLNDIEMVTRYVFSRRLIVNGQLQSRLAKDAEKHGVSLEIYIEKDLGKSLKRIKDNCNSFFVRLGADALVSAETFKTYKEEATTIFREITAALQKADIKTVGDQAVAEAGLRVFDKLRGSH